MNNEIVCPSLVRPRMIECEIIKSGVAVSTPKPPSSEEFNKMNPKQQEFLGSIYGNCSGMTKPRAGSIKRMIDFFKNGYVHRR